MSLIYSGSDAGMFLDLGLPGLVFIVMVIIAGILDLFSNRYYWLLLIILVILAFFIQRLINPYFNLVKYLRSLAN
jgi:hypothetical protein